MGVATYHFDNDTFYDGVDTTHTQAGVLQCGGEIRSMPCCFSVDPECFVDAGPVDAGTDAGGVM